MRLNASELRYKRDSFERAIDYLAHRSAENDKTKVGNDLMFNVTHPYQIVDYPYFEAIYKGKKAVKSKESLTRSEVEANERKRFEEIQARHTKEFEERRKLNGI